MEFILLIFQAVIAVLLIGFVLLQRSDNDGFGMGSGSGGGLMSSRGQANFMTKTTAILAFIFMANSLLLTIMTTNNNASSIIDEVIEEQPFQVPTDGKDIKADAAKAFEDVTDGESLERGTDAVSDAAEEAVENGKEAMDDVFNTLKEQTGEVVDDTSEAVEKAGDAANEALDSSLEDAPKAQ